jgi:ribonuclease R
MVKAILYPEKGYQFMSREELNGAGTFLSACEQRSVKAERQVKSIKKARFMSMHLGEEFEGMISSVTRFGVFVLLRKFDVDGLVRIEELGDDYFEYDEEKLALIGKKSGISYEIGDPIKIVVAKADIEQGQIDLVLAEMPKRKAKKLADFLKLGASNNRNDRQGKNEKQGRHQGLSFKRKPNGQQEKQQDSRRDEKNARPQKNDKGTKRAGAVEKSEKRGAPQKNRGRVRPSRLSKRSRTR